MPIHHEEWAINQHENNDCGDAAGWDIAGVVNKGFSKCRSPKDNRADAAAKKSDESGKNAADGEEYFAFDVIEFLIFAHDKRLEEAKNGNRAKTNEIIKWITGESPSVGETGEKAIHDTTRNKSVEWAVPYGNHK